MCRWNCHPIGCSSRDITISGFGGHIAIFSCRSLSQSLGDTLFGLAMVENPGLAVGIRRYLLYFQWYNYFRFWWPYRYFRLSFDVIVTRWHFLRVRPCRKPYVCRRNWSDICNTVGDSGVARGTWVHVPQDMGTWVHVPRRGWKVAFFSGFWGLTPRLPTGLCPWTPLGDFCPPDLLFCPTPVTNSWLRPWSEI